MWQDAQLAMNDNGWMIPTHLYAVLQQLGSVRSHRRQCAEALACCGDCLHVHVVGHHKHKVLRQHMRRQPVVGVGGFQCFSMGKHDSKRRNCPTHPAQCPSWVSTRSTMLIVQMVTAAALRFASGPPPSPTPARTWGARHRTMHPGSFGGVQAAASARLSACRACCERNGRKQKDKKTCTDSHFQW